VTRSDVELTTKAVSYYGQNYRIADGVVLQNFTTTGALTVNLKFRIRNVLVL
jgi:hypothetical protein